MCNLGFNKDRHCQSISFCTRYIPGSSLCMDAVPKQKFGTTQPAVQCYVDHVTRGGAGEGYQRGTITAERVSALLLQYYVGTKSDLRQITPPYIHVGTNSDQRQITPPYIHVLHQGSQFLLKVCPVLQYHRQIALFQSALGQPNQGGSLLAYSLLQIIRWLVIYSRKSFN